MCPFAPHLGQITLAQYIDQWSPRHIVQNILTLDLQYLPTWPLLPQMLHFRSKLPFTILANIYDYIRTLWLSPTFYPNYDTRLPTFSTSFFSCFYYFMSDSFCPFFYSILCSSFYCILYSAFSCTECNESCERVLGL